jgi:sugar-specific transcriptional regulator TrmB
VNYERFLITLSLFGLSRNDAEIYLYLTAKGRRRAGDIAEEFNFPRHQVYNSLKRLRKKGIVIVNCEQVTTFSAQSFEKIMDSCVRIKLLEAENMRKKREEILSNWRQIITEKDQEDR